ncbi:MAG: type VI secretion system baseplate subunit TssG [Deltaproteobacteria bacterium]|nr:type VI secretion system baseplate subunit TssG [Deltaproteobacteria bacterium]
MATSDRRPALDVKADLLNNGKRFSFMQAVRLLHSISRRTTRDETVIDRTVRARPKLSLDFPGTDIDTIRQLSEDPDRFLLTVTFLGLYGVSSPLPTFYTEDLMDEASEDISVTRDFLDIVNAPFYRLYYRCWTKYRQFVKIIDEQNPEYLERLFCFLGFGNEKHRRDISIAPALIPYIGLFTQFPRSALGLATLLSQILREPRVSVIQCVPRKAVIPEDQRLMIAISGSCLGIDSYIGQEVDDRMGKFRIDIGPVNAAVFHGLLPGSPVFHLMGDIIRLYLDKPLQWETRIALEAGEARTTRLGAPCWSRLGWDTWIFSDQTYPADAEVLFDDSVARSDMANASN